MVEKVIIIGGGPAGLSAAIYTARAALSPLVFAGSPPGGQLMLTSEVENYPGFESILGPELIEKMRRQAKKFGARIIEENVVKVDFSKKPFKIYLSQDGSPEILPQLNSPPHQNLVRGLKHPVSENFGSPSSSLKSASFKVFSAESVLIATGAKALWLGLPSEQRLRGKGVSACATCDGFFFKDKVVAVVGGGDTAMEEALTLTKFAKKVYIIHRRDSFRASKAMQERVFANPKIEIIWNAVVEEVIGKERVEGIRLKSIKDDSTKIFPQVNSLRSNIHSRQNFVSSSFKLKIDGLFVAIGHKPDTDIFAGQIEMDEKGYIITSARAAMHFKNPASHISPRTSKFDFSYQSITSVPGIFAAGDCLDPYYRQAATAVGSGVAAALEVERWLEVDRSA